VLVPTLERKMSVLYRKASLRLSIGLNERIGDLATSNKKPVCED